MNALRKVQRQVLDLLAALPLWLEAVAIKVRGR